MKALLLGVVLLLAGRDQALVGTWSLAEDMSVTFKGDGTGTMDGESFKWSTESGTLLVSYPDGEGETDRLGYAVKGDQLALAMDGIPMTFTRVGKAPKGSAPAAEPKAAAKPAAGKAGTDDLSKLLLSSAWCSFKYNKVSGSTSQERYQYFADGTFSGGSQYEGYSSGSGGSMASQHNSGSAGQWRVQGGQLQVNSAQLTGGQWVTIPLSVTRNSNGYPIIDADGKEFSMCK